MEDLPIGSEIVLKVVKTEKEQCNGCFFDEICNNIYDYIDISVRKGTKVHDILEKEMPLKGVKRSCGAEVCYRVPKTEFEKELLAYENRKYKVQGKTS